MTRSKLAAGWIVAAIFLAWSNAKAEQVISQWSDDRILMVDLIADGYEIKAAIHHPIQLLSAEPASIRVVYLQRGKSVFSCVDNWNVTLESPPAYLTSNPFLCRQLQKPTAGPMPTR